MITYLKKGKPVTTTAAYRLYSGREVLLEQHFIPLSDKQGKVNVMRCWPLMESLVWMVILHRWIH